MGNVPKYAEFILRTLENAGFQAVLVGGCVRDSLLGRRPGDWDIATAATPAQVTALFPHTVPTGVAHGTVTVLHGGGSCEVTTFRADGDYADGRHPESVRFTGRLASDLMRRDFTVNAMAMDRAGHVTDLHGGREDLARRLIRCVGDPAQRFGEDALRMLRAYRFSAQLGFALQEETRAAALRCAPMCAALSAERVRDELKKTLLSPRPELIGRMLADGLLAGRVAHSGELPGLERLASLPGYARPAHLCAAMETAGFITSGEDFLTGLRFDRTTVLTAARGSYIIRCDSRDLKRLLRDWGLDAVKAAYPRSAALRRVLQSGECYTLSRLAVSGDDLYALGYRGREIGDALARALEHVIDHPGDNQKEILLKLTSGEDTHESLG
jgi:tRNA nucleotidyltransferase (CCA-adding enzyme)